MKKIKAFCSWSGGKECSMALHEAQKSGIAVTCLLSKICVFIFIIMILFTSVISASAESSNMMKNQPETNKRIVSLSPAITEALYALGLEDAIVGVTIYCQKPSQAQRKEKIGTLMEPDMEKIVSLKPDLVLTMTLTSPKEIQKLKNLGLKVVTFQIPQDFNLLCDFFLQLGRVVGKEKKSEQLIKEAQDRVSEIAKKVASLRKPKVLIQIGSNPLFVATKKYFLNDYIQFAGGTNIFQDGGLGSVSMEEVIKKNPDIIIIATMGISGENERKVWKRFTTIEAVKKNKVYIVDPDRLCSPTPVSFAGYLAEIVALLHPKE
jgi:ABC-type Fe3+-hydroxamate transport system substrate-binding protein